MGASPDEGAMIDVGHVVAEKYRLNRRLGAGGMGQVFEATNLNTGRRVAIKLILPEFAKTPEMVARFLQEARAAAKVRHPNVIDVLDLDIARDEGVPFIVQEFLVGQTLDEALRAQPDRRMAPRRALEVLVPVMRALAAAHREGVIHRDLKPGNIFLCDAVDGGAAVKVIDFGIARVGADNDGGEGWLRTQTGVMLGTPAYMAPEQIEGARDLDGRCDVWSVGVVLYEALTGALPFEGSNGHVVIGKVLHEAPVSLAARLPSMPMDLCALVHRALKRDRAERHATMTAMLDAALATSTWRGEDLDMARTPTVPVGRTPATHTAGAAGPSTPPALTRAVEPRSQRPRRDAVVVVTVAVVVALATLGGLALRPRAAPSGARVRIAPSVAPSVVAPSLVAPSLVAPSLVAPSLAAPSLAAPSLAAPRVTRVRHVAPRDPLSPAGVGDYGPR